MCKFEANRCGSHDHILWLITFELLYNVLIESAFVFPTQRRFFQRILYLNSAKDDVMLLMCKFEANRCGFRVAENRPLGTFSLDNSVITFVLQTQHRFFPKNPILEFSRR